MRLTSMKLFAMCGLTAGLVACGDDDKPKADTNQPDTTQPDTSVDPDTSVEPDSTQPDSTQPDADTTAPECSRNGYTPLASFFDYNEEYDYTAFGVEDQDSFILVEFYDLGGGSPLIGPGLYPIGETAADRNYETCGTCVLIYADCDTESCNKYFFATGGTIEVTELDQDAGTVVAKVKDLTAVEVTIDTEGETYRSTPVPNGESWCIDSVDVEYNPECTSDAQCTDASKPYCDTDAQACVQCLDFFHCDSAEAPVCLASSGTCGTQTDVCTGDDAFEPNNGPGEATPIEPGTTTAKLCVGTTEYELDWYKFTTTEISNLKLTVTHAAATAMDFNIILFTEAGEFVDAAESEDNPEVLTAPLVEAGDYYALVYLYSGSNVAAVDYTLTLETTAPECTTNADCTDAASPFCNTQVAECVACLSHLDCDASTPVCLADAAGVASCTSIDACTGDDDAREPNDDGPNGATPLTFGTAIDSKICGNYASGGLLRLESDYFTFDAPSAGRLTATLSWATEHDLDVYVYNAEGVMVASAETYDQPENIDDAVEAGKYYVEVYSYSGDPDDVAIDYSLLVNFTAN